LKPVTAIGYVERMGSWGTDLLENDAAADAMDDIIEDIYCEAIEHDGAELAPKEAGPLAARLALVARYRSYEFEQKPGNMGYERTTALRTAIKANRAVILAVAPKAGPLLDRLQKGDVVGELPIATLLDAKHARAYLQDLADKAIEELEDTLGEEQGAGAYLHLPALIAPYVELPRTTVRHWLRRLREAGDPENEFARAYLKACKKLVDLSAPGDEDDADDEDE
jgi:hypothetical protein